MDTYIPSSVLRDRHANINYPQQQQQQQQNQQQSRRQPSCSKKPAAATDSLSVPEQHLPRARARQFSSSSISSQPSPPPSPPSPSQDNKKPSTRKSIIIGQEYFGRSDEDRFAEGPNSEDEADEREYQEYKRARKLKKEHKKQIKELKKEKKQEKQRRREEVTKAAKAVRASSPGVLGSSSPIMVKKKRFGGASYARSFLERRNKKKNANNNTREDHDGNVGDEVGNVLRNDGNGVNSNVSIHPGRVVQQWFRSRFSSCNGSTKNVGSTISDFDRRAHLREGSEVEIEQEQEHDRLLSTERYLSESGRPRTPSCSQQTLIELEEVAVASSSFSSLSISSSHLINATDSALSSPSSDTTAFESSPSNKNGTRRRLLIDTSSKQTNETYAFSAGLSSNKTLTSATRVSPSSLSSPSLSRRTKGPQSCLRRVWSKIHHPPLKSKNIVSTKRKDL